MIGKGSRTQGLGPRCSSQGEMGCETFSKKWWTTILCECNPDVALEWIDMAGGVVMQMGCLPEMWACITPGALYGKIFWEFTHNEYLGARPMKQIGLDEFWDVFYVQYLSFTVGSQKKKEFLALEKREGMPVVVYWARFLTLERFAFASFSSE